MYRVDSLAKIDARVREIVSHSPSEHELSAAIARLAGREGNEVYAVLLGVLASVDLDADISKVFWERALEHRKFLSDSLQRPVGAVIALHDLLANIEQKLTRPKIIELDAFEKIEKSSVTDALTGLYNFAFFREQLEREIGKCVRYGSNLSLILFDLDNFKRFNDTHGHNGGNLALKAFASVMKEKLRMVDLVARFGGEEFVYILPMTAPEGAIVVAERVRRSIEMRDIPMTGPGAPLARITCSAGIAAFAEGCADSAEQLIEKADQALYRAKAAGKNRTVVHAP